MKPVALLVPLALSIVWGFGNPNRAIHAGEAPAGERPEASLYKVLAPIRQGNLTVFPVVAAHTHDTSEFLTLDEGLASGEVQVREYGQLEGLRRGPHPQQVRGQAQVNTLVLINNSKRPLILLAGEIVTGGKQDRVIGKDRLIPAESDPVDLGVFCVEPGRWTATNAGFGSMKSAMAAPNVRAKAMGDKNQQKVWDEVRSAGAGIGAMLSQPAAEAVAGTSSYARVMQNAEVQQKLDSIAAPIEHNYSSLIRELRDRHAVGVVVAVNGELVWADIFASTNLLEKYWPKLIRSYAAQAMVSHGGDKDATSRAAQAFLDNMEGTRESVEREPGLYRHTEISGSGFKVFELTALLPKTDFDLHVAKMAE